MSSQAPAILNVHTPTSSFAIVHSLTEDTFVSLFDKLTKKAHPDYAGARVTSSWVKYEWNGTVWNLDDEADYTIFSWRQKEPGGSGTPASTPTLFLHDPAAPLPEASAYSNPSFYLFRPSGRVDTPERAPTFKSGKAKSTRSSRRGAAEAAAAAANPQHKREFDKFHSENGVRTIVGSIGPVDNVRMLLKSSHSHVYVSRKFAVRHQFVPKDAMPGAYGYGGLVNIGKWPITLGTTPSSREDGAPGKTVTLSVYLSEEPHFDVILGRSFHEARRVRTDPIDPTDVRCMDTGEKVDCEVVVLRDGRGEIVTVT